MQPFLALKKRLLPLLLAAALSASAFAQSDPPGRVGRIAAVNGQVTVGGAGFDDSSADLLNWPVVGDSHIATARGAGAEFRVGSTAVRLDGDTALEITQLDDDNFRLRLNYGSVSVRVKNPGVLAGFELATSQARIVMTQPGRVRVDAERIPNTTVVGVIDGAADIDGSSAHLSVRAGRRAEIRDDDLRTGALQQDRFDDWPEPRYDAGAPALRYVSDEVTGYEELDQYGSWSDNAEYGAVWIPRALPAGWAPYRDGRWVFVQPWGWTWVDDLPWAYAPSHYGRWFMANGRWCWTPGGLRTRPVWSPALVGWVGGGGWQVGFGGGRGTQPAVGWYPLAPRERFVPGYRVSAVYEQRLNAWHDARWGGRAETHPLDERRPGMTIVPNAQFGARNTVPVTQLPHASAAPGQIRAASVGAPPMPAGVRDERNERNERGDGWRGTRPSSPSASPSSPPPVQSQGWQRQDRVQGQERGQEPAWQGRGGTLQPQPALPQSVPARAPQAQQQNGQQQNGQQQSGERERREEFERARRDNAERERRGAAERAAAPQPAPPQAAPPRTQPQPAPQPAPPRMQPQPAPQANQQPAQQPSAPRPPAAAEPNRAKDGRAEGRGADRREER